LQAFSTSNLKPSKGVIEEGKRLEKWRTAIPEYTSYKFNDGFKKKI
jgi:hypothetical protein